MGTKHVYKTLVLLLIALIAFPASASEGYYSVPDEPDNNDEFRPIVTPVPIMTNDPEIDVEHAIQPIVIGSDTAPIKIIQYNSFTCNECANFQRTAYSKIERVLMHFGQVQFEFHEFPFNTPSLQASMLARCVPKDQYPFFMNILYEEQDEWAYRDDYLDRLKKYAKRAAIGDKRIESCLRNEELKDAIIENIRKARDKYGIKRTPTFVMKYKDKDHKIIEGAKPYEYFRDAIIDLSDNPDDILKYDRYEFFE